MRITQTSYYLSVHHLVTKVPKRAEVGSFLKFFYKEMSGYKHVYFPIRGRGERTRLAFVATKVEFEDVRVPFEDWAKEKASGRPPFDELPYIVTPEGKILGQSGAICKYICKKGGLCPSDPFDEALADSLSDGALDLRERLIRIYYEEDAARKEKMQKEFFETTLPARLKKYEGFLESRDGGKAYLFGEKLTYADISIFDFLNNILLGGKTDVPKELDKFPLLAGHYTRVLNVPEIKAWIEKRPQTTG